MEMEMEMKTSIGMEMGIGMETETVVKVEGGSSSSTSTAQLEIWSPWRCNPVADYYISSISTASGTTLSTTYTSSRDSDRRSSDKVQGSCRNTDPDPLHVRELVVQFGGGDAGAVERWLSELDADWVLQLAGNDASQGKLYYDASNNGKKKGGSFEGVDLLFARFIEAVLLKLLPFVTAMCSVGTADILTAVSDDESAVTPAEKLQALVALSRALEKGKLEIALLRKVSLALDQDITSKIMLEHRKIKGIMSLKGKAYEVGKYEICHSKAAAKFPIYALSCKIENYIQEYLQVSWEPVMSCLDDPTPQLCLNLGKSSPMLKFESEFQKTYIAQKLWKVPDPVLRTKLRKAIIKKVTSGFTKHLEDNNNITTSRFTPEELKEMLEDLFEG
ncbi:hypothetical protein ACP4OV_014029 [Aristida adscensionis]